jgi:hypothetical protein
LLADLPFRKYSLCMMNGPPTAPNRLYAMASWWLTYDPNYSVAAPIAPASDGNAVFPEYGIVPDAPKASAGSGRISALYHGGVYVREFERCFQDGRSIGGCATVVNPGTSQRSIPALSRRYTRTLSLSDASVASGGRAVWNVLHPGPEPKAQTGMGRSNVSLGTLGPVQAMVLKQ